MSTIKTLILGGNYMSIFGIDWNCDGNIDFTDTAIDFLVLDEMESEENDDEDD